MASLVGDIAARASGIGKLIKEQIGVCVLPRSALQGDQAVAQLHLSRPRLNRRIMFIWQPANTPPAARAFLALAQHHLADPKEAATGDPATKIPADLPEN